MENPKIRFKGYTDAWEQRKLSEVAEIVGGGTPSTNIPEYWDGDIDWYAPAEINDQIYVDGSERKITKLGLEKSSAKILPADKTVLFTSRARIGKTAILRRSGATNQGFQSMVLNDETNPYFVFSMSKFIKEEAERVASGSTFAEVSGKMLGNLTFMFPTKQEQDKIGEYFSNLDNLITLHQCKCYNSFEMYINAWEQRKLETVATFSKGNGYSKGDLIASGTPIILYGRLYTKYETTITEVDTFVDVKQGSVYSKGGEVIIPASGETAEDIARASTVENAGVLLGGDLNVVTPNEDIDSAFLALTISNGESHKELAKKAQGKSVVHIHNAEIMALNIPFPCKVEQSRISAYFSHLDHLITLHQCRCFISFKMYINAWKQRKFCSIVKKCQDSVGILADGYMCLGIRSYLKVTFHGYIEKSKEHEIAKMFRVSSNQFIVNISFGGEYADALEQLIIFQHQGYICIDYAFKYIKNNTKTEKESIIVIELESMIETKLIEQLVYGDSQWVYRGDLKTEDDLWSNFRYILEQNNKERLNGESLSDAEFEQVKNQLQFSSFYKAGEWLVGENGKVQVHVQRDTERLHLVVMNHEHIAGGSSVYEVINQYSALKSDEDNNVSTRDRRFDVTLMINGLPMIHIELKNKQHSYMDAFWQIKKYIGEGKFTGIFSAVQMFVVSNGVDTKYFSAAGDNELNPKFISGWLDENNNPVSDCIDFAKSVLRIPEAHEMIARYTVLDEDAKRLILLRPYQIHAIEAIRECSKTGKSGYVWHTTGSGKTLTSYKTTRNLLMDIPAIDKAIFLIDRKDLDTQTTMAFQAYANNDLVDVDETENVNDLKNKLKSDDRQVIVTTIQKLHLLITKRLKEDTPEYNKIKNLKIAYVVDECHRTVTPNTKRELERFFGNSLWFGFTGTPRFAENPYPQMGDLPRTTEELYGKCLHKYTIQNAIHDNAVLGFQVEHNGPKEIVDETDTSIYENETHMLKVLDVILNKSFHKFGFQNGRGKTYEGLLTTSSIQQAQKYYELLTKVKNGETPLKINEKIKQILPDFPKFAITYSISENEEGSQVNQQKMQSSLEDYNKMFDTKYELSQIQGYNANLNKRLARKDPKYESRREQLDLVIVVDRLLTGFDAPCMSTIFIDRQPMGPHDLIQAFSRTNRIFDRNKAYGQIVTFQAPVLFKKCVDNAVRLYSAGGTKEAMLAEWDEIESAFRKSLAALRICAETPAEITKMSLTEKKVFVKIFQSFDKLFAQLKSFTKYEDAMLEEYGITEDEYYEYVGHYLNALEEIKTQHDSDTDDSVAPDMPDVDPNYELMAYSNTKIDYEYIINLIQNIVTPRDDSENTSPEERQKQIDEVKQYVEELRKENPKVADIMSNLIYEIEVDENKYKGQSILNVVESIKRDCIDKVITDFCIIWYASKDDVMYAATHYRNGEIPNESAIKASIDYTSYRQAQEQALPKFKYYAKLMAELKKTLDEEVKPLINH